MKKKNGFTMVELLVSLVLITTLSIALFKVVANIQKKEQINIARNSLTAFKAVLNNNIETDFINDTITKLYSCGDNCFDITYKNVIIDSMLKKLLETLKCVKTDYLKIEVKKDYNTIGLIINNINVFEMDFKYEFSKKDIMEFCSSLHTRRHSSRQLLLP